VALDDVPSTEELEEFRNDLRPWLEANMPPLTPEFNAYDQSKEQLKKLQRTLWDGGYAGLAYPTHVGGRGLSRYHHKAFCEEALGYELPIFVGNPGLSIIAPPILEFGTPHQLKHITALLRGDETFVQMMSEPSGGSDMAGARTRATRDGDSWIFNGSKIWSSGAHRADWGFILVRTNWDVPKHRGLSLFCLDLSLPGITINPIMMVDGSDEFCEEFFDDVVVPHAELVGEANDGWTVASRLLFHERDAVGGGSPYAYHRPASTRMGPKRDLARLAQRTGVAEDQHVRELVGEALADELVSRQLIDRVSRAIHIGQLAPIAGSLLRLTRGVESMRRDSIALEIAGAAGVTWEVDEEGEHAGEEFISRQAQSIGGGTNEMQRNLISERLLGMPREFAADKDAPFNQVRRGR
jgi:alkylation response protein AidB-like acyl-CoA dehydrogenase